MPTAMVIRHLLEDAETGKAAGLTFAERIAAATRAVDRELSTDRQVDAKKLQSIVRTRCLGHGMSIPDIIHAGGLVVLVAEHASSVVPLPADTITANKSRHVDLNNPYVIFLLVMAAWALYVIGPCLTTELPPADQAEWSNYWSIVDPIAVGLTGYLISRRSKAR